MNSKLLHFKERISLGFTLSFCPFLIFFCPSTFLFLCLLSTSFLSNLFSSQLLCVHLRFFPVQEIILNVLFRWFKSKVIYRDQLIYFVYLIQSDIYKIKTFSYCTFFYILHFTNDESISFNNSFH